MKFPNCILYSAARQSDLDLLSETFSFQNFELKYHIKTLCVSTLKFCIGSEIGKRFKMRFEIVEVLNW